MLGAEITIKGRKYTVSQEVATGPHAMADMQKRGLTGLQAIVTGARGAVKLVAESKSGNWVVIN